MTCLSTWFFFLRGGKSFRGRRNRTWIKLRSAGSLQASILTESQVIAKGGTMGKDGNFMWGCPGLVRLKYTTWANETSSAAGAVPDLCYGSNLRIIRYSDVLLMASEANLLATPADATTALGQI